MRTIDFEGEFVAPWICYFGSSPSGNTNTVTNNSPWSGQQGYLTDIYSQAQNLDQNSVPQYYPSDTYAPLTSQQTGLMSNLIGATDTGGDSGLQSANTSLTNDLSPAYTAQTQGTFNQGTNVLGNELSSSYLNPANSPTYNTAIANAEAAALPAANASFVNGNRSDSGLAQAASTSAATNAAAGLAQQQYDTNQNIQNSAASTASNNFLTQQGNQSKDLLTAPMVDQAQTSDLNTALTTAGMGQTNNQNQINANVAAYNYGQMEPWNQLGLYEGAVTGTGSPGSSSTTSAPYYSNTAANVASGVGAAGSLAMMAFMIFSDRRIKTDIKKIGESDSGFPLYTFRYKGESPMARHIGLMAQDVEKDLPEAVLHTPGGIKVVDYGMALKPRASMADYVGTAA